MNQHEQDEHLHAMLSAMLDFIWLPDKEQTEALTRFYTHRDALIEADFLSLDQIEMIFEPLFNAIFVARVSTSIHKLRKIQEKRGE